MSKDLSNNTLEKNNQYAELYQDLHNIPKAFKEYGIDNYENIGKEVQITKACKEKDKIIDLMQSKRNGSFTLKDLDSIEDIFKIFNEFEYSNSSLNDIQKLLDKNKDQLLEHFLPTLYFSIRISRDKEFVSKALNKLQIIKDFITDSDGKQRFLSNISDAFGVNENKSMIGELFLTNQNTSQIEIFNSFFKQHFLSNSSNSDKSFKELFPKPLSKYTIDQLKMIETGLNSLPSKNKNELQEVIDQTKFLIDNHKRTETITKIVEDILGNHKDKERLNHISNTNPEKDKISLSGLINSIDKNITEINSAPVTEEKIHELASKFAKERTSAKIAKFFTFGYRKTDFDITKNLVRDQFKKKNKDGKYI